MAKLILIFLSLFLSSFANGQTPELPLMIASPASGTLPTTAATGKVTGARTYVTDATTLSAGVFGGAVVGGGSVTIPVFYNGTTWIVG